MSRKIPLAALVVMLGALGCGQGDDRLRDKARIESEAGAEAEIAAQNENLRKRTREMEEDLELRHRFFSAVSGTYLGQMETRSGPVQIRITLSPSLPPYPSSQRSRTPEELAFELNGLHLNAQIVEWFENSGTEVAFGCTFEGIRPDLGAGTIRLISADCKGSYTLLLADPVQEEGKRSIPPDMSRRIAEGIRSKTQEHVQALGGYKESNLSSQRMHLSLSRSE